MSSHVAWNDIRAEYVARAGGEEAVAAGKREMLASSAPIPGPHTEDVWDRRSYEERRPYALPDTFVELAGPANGTILLPRELGWTGRTRYDLDDPSDAAVFYERVLVEAVRAHDVVRLVNADRLRLLWSRLFLPTRVRGLWEVRFPDLTSAA